jgi:hypothetical protein
VQETSAWYLRVRVGGNAAALGQVPGGTRAWGEKRGGVQARAPADSAGCISGFGAGTFRPAERSGVVARELVAIQERKGVSRLLNVPRQGGMSHQHSWRLLSHACVRVCVFTKRCHAELCDVLADLFLSFFVTVHAFELPIELCRVQHAGSCFFLFGFIATTSPKANNKLPITVGHRRDGHPGSLNQSWTQRFHCVRHMIYLFWVCWWRIRWRGCWRQHLISLGRRGVRDQRGWTIV